MKEFSILDYGAKCSDALQTEQIQAAIDACFLAGGGRVTVPCGVFLTGGLRIRSNVELYLQTGAILKGSCNCQDYFGFTEDKLEPVAMEENVRGDGSTCATSRWSNGLIRAFDAENIRVVGEKGSYIDGVNCFDPMGEEKYRGPHGMSFWRCRNIHLEGYTFINSANWCHAIFQSQNITVRNVTVLGGHDGVDLRTCDNARIEDCNFNVGDDSIAGFDNNDVVVRTAYSTPAALLSALAETMWWLKTVFATILPTVTGKSFRMRGSEMAGWRTKTAAMRYRPPSAIIVTIGQIPAVRQRI